MKEIKKRWLHSVQHQDSEDGLQWLRSPCCLPHTGTSMTPLCLRLFHGKPETPCEFVGRVK